MNFAERRYGRSRILPKLTYEAASLLDRRDARIVRRQPAQAAVIRAERILIANRQKEP